MKSWDRDSIGDAFITDPKKGALLICMRIARSVDIGSTYPFVRELTTKMILWLLVLQIKGSTNLQGLHEFIETPTF